MLSKPRANARLRVFGSKELGFIGNSSSVFLLNSFPSDETLQEWARLEDQPASTFLVPFGSKTYSVKWFSPEFQIDLCGHGTACAAAFLKNKNGKSDINFIGDKAQMKTEIKDGLVQLFLSPIKAVKSQIPVNLQKYLSSEVIEYYKTSNKDLVVFKNAEDLKSCEIDFIGLRELKTFGYTFTSPDKTYDYASRTILPFIKEREDEATGSSQAVLVPFWSERLKKHELKSIQLSSNGAIFNNSIQDNIITISGQFEFLDY